MKQKIDVAINNFMKNNQKNDKLIINNIAEIDESLSKIELNFSKLIKQIEENK